MSQPSTSGLKSGDLSHAVLILKSYGLIRTNRRVENFLLAARITVCETRG